MTNSEKIKFLRKVHNINMKQIAKETGISYDKLKKLSNNTIKEFTDKDKIQLDQYFSQFTFPKQVEKEEQKEKKKKKEKEQPLNPSFYKL